MNPYLLGVWLFIGNGISFRCLKLFACGRRVKKRKKKKYIALKKRKKTIYNLKTNFKLYEDNYMFSNSKTSVEHCNAFNISVHC